MTIKELSLAKSKTVGFITTDGRTKFKKIIITVSADINKDDDPTKSCHKLSEFIEDQFSYEKNVNY